MGSKISKLPSNQCGWNLRRLKRKDVNSQFPSVEITYQPSLKGDFEKVENSAVSPLQTSEVKISPTSICSKTSSVELSSQSSSTPSTVPTLHSGTDFTHVESTVDSDSAADSRGYKEKLKQRTSTPSSKMMVSQKSRRPRKMVSTTAAPPQDAPGMEENKRGRYECHFWVPETASSVFTDKNDRRLKSIARSSGCSIELTNDSKLDPFGIPKRKVLIRSVTTYGMAKCRNLIEARFPNFTVRRVPVTPEIVS
ncbi:hypothetical protein EmuJ_000138500 [Echinococcus multilocularis]|uniref:Uncharacterized protein n=1 Tax=Echinococcus multilocularis TaxID=6211 RepID=A0A087VZQ6_ECHMU|nr:hypothetical protein EmuJ_000138500 [Echinococcus multilocularis]